MSNRLSGLQGSVLLIAADGSLLKLPIPSRSARDPLNWSARKRAGAFIALLFNAIIVLVLIQIASVLLKPLAMEFTPKDTAPFNLTILLSMPTIFLGIGTSLWIPLTLAVGRRPVFLLSSLILLLGTISIAETKSFYQLLVSLCFLGLASGFSNTAIYLVIIDLTYIDERPKAIGMIWAFISTWILAICAVIPQIPLFNTNWRAVFRYAIIPCGINMLSAFFLCPETYYVRPPIAFDGHVLVQSSEEKLHIYEGWDETPGGKVLPEVPDRYFLNISRNDLRFWGCTKRGWRAMRACYCQVLLCAINPLIFWVALLWALMFGSMLVIGETYALVLIQEPYEIPPNLTALVNLGGSFGALLVWPETALLVPWISHRLTIRNRGIREAEYCLPSFILPVLTGCASIIIYGLTVEYKLHYSLIYFSYGLNNFSFAALGAAVYIWVTEAFPQYTAPALVIVGGISYSASFALSFAIVPWIRLQGYGVVGIEIGMAILVVGCVGVPVAFWGKSLRQYIHGRWALNQEGALRPQ